jgi:Rieske Fe-S protein
MSHTRRDLLRAWAVVVAAACRPQGAESVDGDSPGDTDPTGETDDGPYDPCVFVAGTEAEGWVPLELSRYPDLEDVGGWVHVDVGGRRLVVGQVAEGCYVAMDRICTHEGCDIELRFGRFVCPCHGSVFAVDGTVQAGPAPLPVAVYPAAPKDAAIWVKTG